jgi:protein PhnA
VVADQQQCPKCEFDYPYEQGEEFICPECSHHWPILAPVEIAEVPAEFVVKDAHGNILKAGDSVTVVKDLKVKGSSSAIKVGTKVRVLGLTEGDHNIDCRIEGIGEMKLKSEFVKKA